MGDYSMAYVSIEDGENFEKALKRLKRQVEKEGIIREWKKKWEELVVTDGKPIMTNYH